MEKRARRWIVWSGITAALVACVLIAASFAYWYVIWPFSPEWVIRTSPWLEPQVRGFAKFDDSGNLFSRQPELKQLIVDGIEARGDEGMRELLGCLRTSDEKVRRSVLWMTESIVDAGLTSAAWQQEIVSLVADPDPGLRMDALRAVCFLPEDVARPVLKPFVGRLLGPESDYYLRTIVIQILTVPGDVELTSAILPLLADNTAELRRTALRGLTIIGDTSAILAVQRLLEDSDPEVRREAKRFLTQVQPVVDVPSAK